MRATNLTHLILIFYPKNSFYFSTNYEASHLYLHGSSRVSLHAFSSALYLMSVWVSLISFCTARCPHDIRFRVLRPLLKDCLKT